MGRVDLVGNPCQKVDYQKLPVSEKIRGVLNNIPDILVKVRGSGVKFRFWTPFDPNFGRETCQIYGKITQSKSSQTDFCDGLHDFKTTKLRSGAF